MNIPNSSKSEAQNQPEVDPIDRDAAEIDARSKDASAQIEEMIEHAEAIGRDAPQPIESDGDDTEDGDDDDEPELLPG